MRWCCPVRRDLSLPEIRTMPCFDADGEAYVLPPPEARAPVVAHWQRLEDRGTEDTTVTTSRPGNMCISRDTLRAARLVPGTYSVHLTDADGARSGARTVEIGTSRVVVVTGYTVTDASSDLTRDGGVEASLKHAGSGASAASAAGTWSETELLWSTGATTLGPVLRDVRPGRYVATVLSVGGAPCRCLHACAPAVVGIAERE